MNETEDLNYSNLFDYYFEFPPKNINFKELIKNSIFYYYQGLIYKGIIKYKNNKTYRGVILECDNSKEIKSPKIFNEYSSKKLYF